MFAPLATVEFLRSSTEQIYSFTWRNAGLLSTSNCDPLSNSSRRQPEVRMESKKNLAAAVGVTDRRYER